MKLSIEEIAELLHADIQGSIKNHITEVLPIDESMRGSLVFLTDKNLEHKLYKSEASAIVVPRDFTYNEPLVDKVLLRVERVKDALQRMLLFVNDLNLDKQGYETPSYIHESAQVGSEVYIGAFSYIGSGVCLEEGVKIYPQSYIGDGVYIGKHTVIHAGVKIYRDSVIGAHCILHAGSVIGGDGFGFFPNEQGDLVKRPHIGKVIIGDYVEIGSCTTIDRAVIGATRIGKGVKLDNHIHIAHNVRIGERTIIAAQTGVAGSSTLGAACMLGGQVGISDHTHIGDDVKIAAQSGLSKNTASGAILQGSPAYEARKYQQSYMHFKKLPDLARRLNQLEKRLDNGQ